jgi:putative DNA primase/helicase
MPPKTKQANLLAKVKIVGEGFDDVGGRYLKLKVIGSTRNLPAYSMDQILKPDRIYRDLSDAGANVFSQVAQRQLRDMLQNFKPQEPSFSVVTRLGSFGRYYVRPKGVIGKPLKPVELALSSLDPHMLSKYRTRGTLQEWNEKIGSLCKGNSRLMFGASLACTGPILRFVSGPRTGGFQIIGPAEKGKTAKAMVAGSIWGCHRDSARKEKGFAESWNTTINELEETALAHSDALLIIDETHLAGDTEKKRASAILDATFRLSEGTKRVAIMKKKRRRHGGYIF